MGKRVVVHLYKLIDEHNISMRRLGRLADIRPAALNALASQKRKRVELDHIRKIAEALDIKDMNKIISLEDTDDDDHDNNEG